MNKTVEQYRNKIGDQSVTTFVFKCDDEALFILSLPPGEQLSDEIENWLHGDGSEVARLRRMIEEPFIQGAAPSPLGELATPLSSFRRECGCPDRIYNDI